MTVSAAWEFFAEKTLQRGLGVLREVGVDYLRLCQSVTELSGGEAQHTLKSSRAIACDLSAATVSIAGPRACYPDRAC
ncbi:MAG TPA: hypothetical protein VGF97_05835 [Rhizomicrobium sp.]|jgi:excinuclease UvrABC ATPase subunit